MADIRAFAAIRPRKGLEARIAALPYDVYNTDWYIFYWNQEWAGCSCWKGAREGISCRRIRHVITCMV